MFLVAPLLDGSDLSSSWRSVYMIPTKTEPRLNRNRIIKQRKSTWHRVGILFLRLLLRVCFDWEDKSNTVKHRESVSSDFQTPGISSKILRCVLYFQLSSRYLEIGWNTVSRVWLNKDTVISENDINWLFVRLTIILITYVIPFITYLKKMV